MNDQQPALPKFRANTSLFSSQGAGRIRGRRPTRYQAIWPNLDPGVVSRDPGRVRSRRCSGRATNHFAFMCVGADSDGFVQVPSRNSKRGPREVTFDELPVRRPMRQGDRKRAARNRFSLGACEDTAESVEHPYRPSGSGIGSAPPADEPAVGVDSNHDATRLPRKANPPGEDHRCVCRGKSHEGKCPDGSQASCGSPCVESDFDDPGFLSPVS